MAGPKFDALTKVMADKINDGIAQISAANEVLLASESGTNDRDIDKVLKTEAAKGADSELPEVVLNSFNEAQALYTKYRELVTAARNTYRTEVLKEDAKTSSEDVDQDSLKETRTVVMDAITFVKNYSKQNGLKDVEEWVSNLQVPQIGRKGTSTVGAKKPRVYVTIGEKIYNSFGEAAAALSDKDNKVIAGDLSLAWNEAGGNEGEFDFRGVTVTVTNKPKKSDG